jgi:hypothetical protein
VRRCENGGGVKVSQRNEGCVFHSSPWPGAGEEEALRC